VQTTDVLVVGAGPTGLVLALWLTRLGVRVRIVDKAAEPGQTSRAVAVQARTLELYAPMGLARPLVDDGLPFAAANVWVKGAPRGRVEFGPMGKGLSPFPFMLVYPQDAHERLLIARLAEAGVSVERPVEVTRLDVGGDSVTARLERGTGREEPIEAQYVAGCDGARSFVREALGVEFPGGTYAPIFYVADVDASGPQMNGELHVAIDDSDFVALFPMKGNARVRLIGTIRGGGGDHGDKLDWSVVHKLAIERIHLKVERVNWFSTYRVHHRVASAFRVGRAFLLGDAAHIHSPVGGQGMNTGIGDAVNLAWKLASVVHGRAHPEPLLSTYEEERVPFAHRLVRTTDRAFELVSATGSIANQIRLGVAPHVITRLFRSPLARRWLFGTVSQIRIRYPRSALSEGKAGKVRGGDRLPWIENTEGEDNYAGLSALAWQAQVHGNGDGTDPLRHICDARRLPLVRYAWRGATERAGVAPNALYLVRPDGYVALASDGREAPQALERYLDTRGLRFDDGGRV
jgi:2-polyprenyl-6-methoxyphenol hydroxylase-like FAD-dependent oxidoreductase